MNSGSYERLQVDWKYSVESAARVLSEDGFQHGHNSQKATPENYDPYLDVEEMAARAYYGYHYGKGPDKKNDEGEVTRKGGVTIFNERFGDDSQVTYEDVESLNPDVLDEIEVQYREAYQRELERYYKDREITDENLTIPEFYNWMYDAEQKGMPKDLNQQQLIEYFFDEQGVEYPGHRTPEFLNFLVSGYEVPTYWLQEHFDNLAHLDPIFYDLVGLAILNNIQAQFWAEWFASDYQTSYWGASPAINDPFFRYHLCYGDDRPFTDPVSNPGCRPIASSLETESNPVILPDLQDSSVVMSDSSVQISMPAPPIEPVPPIVPGPPSVPEPPSPPLPPTLTPPSGGESGPDLGSTQLQLSGSHL